MYTEAVELALKHNLIHEAKEYANKPIDDNSEDTEFIKKLWLKVSNLNKD